MKRHHIVIACGVLLAAIILLVRPDWTASLRRVFSTTSLVETAAYVRGFGVWAPLVSIALMVLQTIIMPLPGALVSAANGLVFGVWWGTLLSWTGGMIGATLAFWLSRRLGADFVARQVGREQLHRLDELSARHGFWAILIARLIPGLSFDLISYLAGLSRIGYPSFLAATGIGMIPGALFFNALGHDLAQAQDASARLSFIALLGVLGYLLGWWWYRRRSRD